MQNPSRHWRSLTARLLRWRDRTLSDPVFQRRSLRWFFARPIARRRMRALFDLCSGFVYSQVLLACVRLDLFEILGRSPCSANELALELKLPVDSLNSLLTAAESLRLIEARGDRFGLGPLGAALRGNPAVAMMIEHHAKLYADLHDPVALLRDPSRPTQLRQFWAYAASEDPSGLDTESTRGYSELMSASQELIADQVLRAYPVYRHRRLLDVGGGSGAFALAALEQVPELEVEMFDLPPVAGLARERFDRRGFSARARATGGDFRFDALPEGCDLVSLVRIVHDHDDDAVENILKSIRRAIAADGVLLIAEPMLGTRGAEPVAAAYFGFYLLAMGQGRPRTPIEIRDLLRRNGFAAVTMHRTTAPLLARVITARPAKN
jgi:demethylspheroidene O-methyltransferase